MNRTIYVILIIIAIAVGVILMLNRKEQFIENEGIIKHVSMDDIVEIMKELLQNITKVIYLMQYVFQMKQLEVIQLVNSQIKNS